MTGKPREICSVRYCRLTATRDCPLPGSDDEALDLGVCGTHGAAMDADPAGWIVTSLPTSEEPQIMRKEDAPQ